MSLREADFVCIRGQRLKLDELVDDRLQKPDYLRSLHEQLKRAQPFEHIVVDGWFNPTLLDLVTEEFDEGQHLSWKTVGSNNELTQRSEPGTMLGPASMLYFGLVNSGWFVRLISTIAGVPDLVVDPQLYGGGLHETRRGGHFGVHRDFDRHVRTGLKNEMVFITYLNKNWLPEWGGALELWNDQQSQCVAKVEPEFGRTLLMPHGDKSYHGHPHPLSPPDGIVRRSIAAYYYSNRYAEIDREARRTSLFLFESHSDRFKRIGKAVTPPVIWDIVAKMARK